MIKQNLTEDPEKTGGYVDIFTVERDFNKICEHYRLSTIKSDDGNFSYRAAPVILDDMTYLVFVKFDVSPPNRFVVAGKRSDSRRFREVLNRFVAEWKLTEEEFWLDPDAFKAGEAASL